jgi:hypothetical protein
MSAINWSEIAMQCGPSIGSLRRGVLRISHFGFYVLFVPNLERARVERELATEGITIHGIALHTLDGGEQIFLAVVKAGNEEKLRAITHGDAAT